MSVSPPHITGGFDLGRIRWGIADRDYLGIDPRYTSFIVRRHSFSPAQNEGHFSSEQGLAYRAKEFSRLADCGFTIPRHTLGITTEEGGREITYEYVQRIHGEALDLQYKPHHPYALAIGRSIISYLEETPVGAAFYDEALWTLQFTVGTPFFQRRREPVAYMHDTGCVSKPNYREQPGQPPTNPEAASYQECLEDLTWLQNLPGSEQRDQLLERVDALLGTV